MNEYEKAREAWIAAMEDFVEAKVNGMSLAQCFDCGRKYGEENGFPDLVIDDEAWRRISPNHDESGLLCPSCICRRLHVLGIKTRVRFTSGPLCEDGDESEAPESLQSRVDRLAKIVKRSFVEWLPVGERPNMPGRWQRTCNGIDLGDYVVEQVRGILWFASGPEGLGRWLVGDIDHSDSQWRRIDG